MFWLLPLKEPTARRKYPRNKQRVNFVIQKHSNATKMKEPFKSFMRKSVFAYTVSHLFTRAWVRIFIGFTFAELLMWWKFKSCFKIWSGLNPDVIRELFLEFPQRLLEDVHEQKRTETSRRTLWTKKPRVICKSVEQCHANWNINETFPCKKSGKAVVCFAKISFEHQQDSGKRRFYESYLQSARESGLENKRSNDKIKTILCTNKLQN